MQIEDIQKKIVQLQELKTFIMNNKIEGGDNLETIVFKKYLELESVTKVAEYINELGYRKDKQRKYISNDISFMLKNKDAEVNKELKEFVSRVFIGHKKGNKRRRY